MDHLKCCLWSIDWLLTPSTRLSSILLSPPFRYRIKSTANNYLWSNLPKIFNILLRARKGILSFVAQKRILEDEIKLPPAQACIPSFFRYPHVELTLLFSLSSDASIDFWPIDRSTGGRHCVCWRRELLLSNSQPPICHRFYDSLSRGNICGTDQTAAGESPGEVGLQTVSWTGKRGYSGELRDTHCGSPRSVCA